MKKILALLLTLVMILSLVPITMGEEKTEYTFVAPHILSGEYMVEKGGKSYVAYQVKIEGFDPVTTNFASFQINLQFDNTKLKVNTELVYDSELGEMVTAWMIYPNFTPINNENIHNNVVVVAGDSGFSRVLVAGAFDRVAIPLAEPAGAGADVLLTIYFEILGDPEEGTVIPLTFTKTEMTVVGPAPTLPDIDTNTYTVDSTNGSITIGEKPCEHKNDDVDGYLAPTCTADGYEGDLICLDCEEVLLEGEPIPKLGHNHPASDDNKAATCTAAGLTGKTDPCTRCEEPGAAGTVLPALGHNHLASADNKAATCTAAGLTGKTDPCTRCSALGVAGTVLPALGHNHPASDDNKAATCTAAGLTGKTDPCTRCEESGAAGTVLAAAGHSWGEGADANGWVVITPAKCGIVGEKARACANCDVDDVASAEIPAIIDCGNGDECDDCDGEFCDCPCCILWGDANNDGLVNAADAAAILRHLVQLTQLSEKGERQAKVMGNATFSAADAAKILRFLVQLVTDIKPPRA
ncbi:MAG: dockerin type I repeat-containing protein [Clostridiales bacterium]|nr:dockerin type I repeat-containing protein [Clostridiales bacterium]